MSKISRADLVALYQDAGLQRYEAADFLGRSARRWRHWELHGAPEWAGRMLRMRAGWLDEYGWDGWRLRDGTLWSIHCGEGFRPEDLYASLWLRQARLSYALEHGRTNPNQPEGNRMSE